MNSGAMYFDAVVVRGNDDTDTVTVLQAPPVTAISPELYEQACAGGLPHVLAGEGLFVINAENGIFRYRLTGGHESYSYALMAEKISGPEVTP